MMNQAMRHDLQQRVNMAVQDVIIMYKLRSLARKVKSTSLQENQVNLELNALKKENGIVPNKRITMSWIHIGNILKERQNILVNFHMGTSYHV